MCFNRLKDLESVLHVISIGHDTLLMNYFEKLIPTSYDLVYQYHHNKKCEIYNKENLGKQTNPW